jgi:hypothetical protein
MVRQETAMSTQKQIEASRINGAKSQGPVTPEGKQISSANATRHGLLSGSIVLKGESIERFGALYDALLAEHQPATQSEVAVVNAMAVALWRQLRVWGFEKLSVDLDIANHDGPAWHTALLSYLTPDGKIGTLLRYETAYSRQFSRALRELNALKARRSGVTPPPPALVLTGATWDPIEPPSLNDGSASTQ